MSFVILGTYSCWEVFIDHLKFRFHWKFCILFGNLILEEFCVDFTQGRVDLILLPMDLSCQVIFPMTTFLLPTIPRRCLKSLLFFWLGMCFLASQSLPSLYLHLDYVNHQFLFFLSFSWDATRISEQWGFCVVKRGYKYQCIWEPLGNINVWSRTGDVQ